MTKIPSDQHITYQLQYRKCGKDSCSTCRTTKGHGPYWYAYWRVGSKLRSGYIGKATQKQKNEMQQREMQRQPKGKNNNKASQQLLQQGYVSSASL